MSRKKEKSETLAELHLVCLHIVKGTNLQCHKKCLSGPVFHSYMALISAFWLLEESKALPEKTVVFLGAVSQERDSSKFQMKSRILYPMEGGTALITFEGENGEIFEEHFEGSISVITLCLNCGSKLWGIQICDLWSVFVQWPRKSWNWSSIKSLSMTAASVWRPDQFTSWCPVLWRYSSSPVTFTLPLLLFMDSNDWFWT